MENILPSAQRQSKSILAPTILAVIYAFGAVGFTFFWAGQQSIPGFTGYEQHGLIYVAICALGFVCNLGIVRGHRWGVFGQIGLWAVTAIVNLLLYRSLDLYFGLALLFVGLWAFDVYRNRRLLG